MAPKVLPIGKRQGTVPLDLKGSRFGKLVAEECIGRTPGRHFVWRCLCDCGLRVDLARQQLVDAKGRRSCGCDIGVLRVGATVGELVLQERRIQGGGVRWFCDCVCGAKVSYLESALTAGKATSCGRCGKNRLARGVAWCSGHKTELPVGLFSKDKANPNGLATHCKGCSSKSQSNSYRKNIQLSRAKRRVYVQRESKQLLRERRQRIHWSVRAAHLAVMRAVRDKVLVRPTQCSRCPEKHRIEAHHDDYSLQLHVQWLCTACHRVRHKELRKLGIDPQANTRHLKKPGK